MKSLWLVLVVGSLFAAAPAGADVWDVQTTSDDTYLTGNELSHGTNQVHDLQSRPGLADEDWYTLGQMPFSSYEVVVEGTSGDTGPQGPSVALVSYNGTVIQYSQAIHNSKSQTLRWANMTSDHIANQYIRVRSDGQLGGCTLDCGPDDQYTIRFYDTTIAVPRFNNSGTQVTTLIIQNPTTLDASAHVYFFGATGTLLYDINYAVNAHTTLAQNTAGLVPSQSGSIVITHNARYGNLAGKAVALEPATGFSFDTPFVVKPH